MLYRTLHKQACIGDISFFLAKSIQSENELGYLIQRIIAVRFAISNANIGVSMEHHGDFYGNQKHCHSLMHHYRGIDFDDDGY